MTIEWLSSQPPAPELKSLAHVDCTAKVPVLRARLADAPWPEVIQAHLSPFSAPEESTHPPAGNWSVMVSAYSWPPTTVTPSSVPALPPLTKFSPQLAPTSVRYGRFVKATGPPDDEVLMKPRPASPV